jgi:hypothetical protein
LCLLTCILHPEQVRVMLFARDNNVKLYRVFNALSLQYPQIKFAVVAQAGASALEARCHISTPDFCTYPKL